MYPLGFLALLSIFHFWFSFHPQPPFLLAYFSHGHIFSFLCHSHSTCLHFHCCLTLLKGLSPHLNPLYLLSEGTGIAPAGHLAVVKAAQTVT